MSASIKNRRPNPKPTSGRNTGRSVKTQDKSYSNDGIYGNKRYSHVAASLIGCYVQIQTKNKDIFDGVLVAFSPEMKVVLKKAHKVNEIGSVTTPSKDLIEDTVIFHIADVVAININDVDLDYAVRDTFTDSGISKYNGQLGEKELTPWDSEGGEEIMLDNETTNGWDPNDMFRTNKEQFNVQSTYDEKLSQYTTVLDKSNPQYRKREELASKMAQEIERTDGYRARLDLENGDGDEEDLYSAVVRPSENSQSNGKYIPPNQRAAMLASHGDGPRRGSPSRTTQQNHNRHGNTHPSQQLQQQHVSVTSSQAPPPPAGPHLQPSSVSPVTTSPTPTQTVPAKLPSQPTHTEKTSEQHHTINADNSSSTSNTEDKTSSPNSKTGGSRDELKRDEQIRELKEFSNQFKLSDSDGKTLSEESSDRLEESTEMKESEPDSKDKQIAETVKKSTLNPNAKEFVYMPKPLQPKHSNASTPTPPRPQTQSPVITQYPMSYIFPVHTMAGAPMGASQQKLTKRAVVSMNQRSDFTAAAQAATGQPLLAQSFLPYQIIPGNMPQPSHSNYTQLMPVNPGTRMPPNVSVMSNNGQGQEHNQQYAMPFMLAPPVPAHLPHAHQPPTPAHLTQHPGVSHHPQQQHPGGQMGHQSGGHHPSPSPVQIHSGHPSQQGHPPNSGTPQHFYQTNPGAGIGQQNHPPLQASPHNPTSPSAIHHLPMSYSFTHAGPSMQGGPPMSLPQGHPPSSGPHMMHVAHTGAGPHQMMIPHHQHNQMQQIHGQFPTHQVPGHNQGPGGHVVQQSTMGVIPASQSSNMPYIPHHQVPNQGMPVQPYPHNQ